MKKSLFLLPLLAGLALCSCGGGGDNPDKPSGGDGGLEEPIVLDYDYLFEAAGSKKTGYAAIAEIDEVEGYEASFTSVCVMNYWHDSVPAWDPATEDDGVKVIQFKAGEGEFSLYDIQPSKVTVVLLTSYAYKSGDNISVEFDGTKVKEKKASTEETEWAQYGTKKEGNETVTDYDTTHAISKITFTFAVSAKEFG